MSTFSSPADQTELALAQAASVNNLDAAVAIAFALLPDETVLRQGKVTYAVDTGAANAYLVALPQTLAGYTDGNLVVMKPSATNTGASTINVDSLGVKSIRRSDSSALAAGDITVGVPIAIRYSTTTGFYHIDPNALAAATAAAASAVAAAASAAAALVSENAAAVSAASIANVISILGLLSDMEYNSFHQVFNATMGSTGTASGDIVSVVFGEAVAFGDVCYIDTAQNEWMKALGTNAAVKHPVAGIALETKTNGQTGKLLLRGTIRDDTIFAAAGAGDLCFLSDGTAGDVLYAAPSDSGDIVQILGFVLVAATTIFFNPDYTYVEVA